LVQRAQQGDRQAQQELYKLYAGAMFNICRRMMGHHDPAQDVLQDAFVEVFTKLHTLRNPDLFGAWIKRLVVNQCIGALKKQRRLQGLQEDFELPDPSHREQEDAEWASHEAQRILWAIDQISDGCKAILNLYLFEGYDHQEIAEILSITESTSKAQYSKAKKKVRQVLEAQTA
jgi:RNA polymerase sigma-70 factor (ECF subfamily)